MTAVVTRRAPAPLTELIDWLESEVPLGMKRIGLMPSVPIEDFVDDGTYVVRAELPGIDPVADVSVTLENSVLTIKGERHESKQDKRIQEIQYGAFSRSVRVPSGTKSDDIEATYRDGVLEVRVPIAVDKGEARVVKIKHAK